MQEANLEGFSKTWKYEHQSAVRLACKWFDEGSWSGALLFVAPYEEAYLHHDGINGGMICSIVLV
jgi:hypothetical protein